MKFFPNELMIWKKIQQKANQEIIKKIQLNKNKKITFKILPQTTDFLIGSNSSNDRGEVIPIPNLKR